MLAQSGRYCSVPDKETFDAMDERSSLNDWQGER